MATPQKKDLLSVPQDRPNLSAGNLPPVPPSRGTEISDWQESVLKALQTESVGAWSEFTQLLRHAPIHPPVSRACMDRLQEWWLSGKGGSGLSKASSEDFVALSTAFRVWNVRGVYEPLVDALVVSAVERRADLSSDAIAAVAWSSVMANSERFRRDWDRLTSEIATRGWESLSTRGVFELSQAATVNHLRLTQGCKNRLARETAALLLELPKERDPFRAEVVETLTPLVGHLKENPVIAGHLVDFEVGIVSRDKKNERVALFCYPERVPVVVGDALPPFSLPERSRIIGSLGYRVAHLHLDKWSALRPTGRAAWLMERLKKT